MSNMSYCRFQNTLSDLRDCIEHLHDAEIKGEEAAARIEIAKRCQEIAAYLNDFDIEPAQLGTDEDPNAAVRCSECRELERPGLVDAKGRCEGCTEENPYVCFDGHTELDERCKFCRETMADEAETMADEGARS